MPYAVKEIYYTIQGEGVQAGRPAVFLRFAGCNLWTGREEDRSKAICQFCDTDFVGTNGPGGGVYTDADSLADAVRACWNARSIRHNHSFDSELLDEFLKPSEEPMVVCTGGEPSLQLDDELVMALHERGILVAIETNGTRPLAHDIDWICVSPKAGSEVVVREGHELKLVYPQPTLLPEFFEDFRFQHFLLQPMDGPHRDRNTALARAYCTAHPKWHLSLQMHKIIGLA